MLAYPVEIEKDDNNTYRVSFPDVPEAHTFGDTRQEALAYAVEVLEAALTCYIDDAKDLPKPSAKRGRPMVSPSLIGEMKLGIYKAMREARLRKTDLARRMGVALMQVDRLLDLTHSSRVEQLEAAYSALGKRVHVELDVV